MMSFINCSVWFILFTIGFVVTRDADIALTYSCHLRLASNDKQDLKCPSGYVLHIHGILCSGQSPCPTEFIDTIYGCEGVPSCDISNMKLEQSQIATVDYICVSEKVLENKCSVQLNPYFGILTRPDSESRKRTVKTCNWQLNATREEMISIVFHYASWHNDCQKAVNISYTDCFTNKWQTKIICGLEPESIRLTSCGPIRISSRPTMDLAGNYVISHHKKKINTENGQPSTDHDSRSSPDCILQVPDNINTRLQMPSPKFQKSSTPMESIADQNFEPSDGIINFMEPSDRKDNSSQSGSIFNKPKLIILYVFFGIIILVLSVALIAVLISYYRLSKDESCHGDSSEKAALWRDTPMETFLTNSMADGSVASETIYPNDSDQLVATVHSDGLYESTDIDHRLSSGSGISTFLSGKQVSDMRDLIHTFQTGNFAMYDELNQQDCRQEAGYYQTAGSEDMNNIYEAIERDVGSGDNNNIQSVRSVPKEEYLKPDQNAKEVNPCGGKRIYPSPDDYHFCVNNDEYAIVHKPSKPHNNYLNDELVMLDSSINVDFRPTSGPYDRSRNSAIRFSKGEKWKDDY